MTERMFIKMLNKMLDGDAQGTIVYAVYEYIGR